MAPLDSHDSWCMSVLGAREAHFQEEEDAPGERPRPYLRPPGPPIPMPPLPAAPPAAVVPPAAGEDDVGARKVTDGPGLPEDKKADKASAATVRKAVKAQDWPKAADLLMGMGESSMLKTIQSLPKTSVKKLHEAAIADPALGKNSPVALATAAIDDTLLGTNQSARAKAIEEKMSPKDKERLHKIMDGKKPVKELNYLEKGLAAGHSIEELEKFSKKIAGKNDKWMQDNLSLTADSHGKGVKQQWSMSCNATVVQAVKGELDPIYALKMHEDNSDLTDANDKDATKKNKVLGEEQRKMLEKAQPDGKLGGEARSRSDPESVRGRWNTDLLNDNSESTGLEYARQRMDTPEQLEAGVTAINEAVGKRMPVPLVVGDGLKRKNAHYVLITGTDPGPPRYYSIHDPASGDTVVRSEDQLRKGNLDLKGWNKVAAFEKPTPVEVK